MVGGVTICMLTGRLRGAGRSPQAVYGDLANNFSTLR